MIFNCRKKVDPYSSPYEPGCWYRAFAWLPLRVSTTECLWLNWYWWRWEYVNVYNLSGVAAADHYSTHTHTACSLATCRSYPAYNFLAYGALLASAM